MNVAEFSMCSYAGALEMAGVSLVELSNVAYVNDFLRRLRA